MFFTTSRPALRGFVVAATSVCAQLTNDAASSATLPTPQISFQGENITNTKKPIKVAVGQMIKLDADQQGTRQFWYVSTDRLFGNLKIGSKPPDCPYYPIVEQQPCVVYTPVDFSQPKIVFFFATTGTFNVSYKYYDARGNSASSSTAFTSEGPQSIVVTHQFGDVKIEPSEHCLADCRMGLYNGHELNEMGVILDAAGKNPKGLPGNFLWTQQVWITSALEIGGQVYTCPLEFGLDNKYPASDISRFQDRPSVGLVTGQQSFSEQFLANTQLLWQAQTSDYVLASRPVHLGDVSWSWYGTADFSDQTGWSLAVRSTTEPVFHAYDPPVSLEPWYTVLMNIYTPECNP